MDDQRFLELIPHRPPMVLIDAISRFGAKEISATRTVRAGDPFVTDDGLEDAALLEVIAQTIAGGDAAFAESKGGKVLRGYLTGLTGVKLHGRAQVGETIEIDATCLRRMEGMGLFSVTASTARGVLAEGRYKLFVEIDYSNTAT